MDEEEAKNEGSKRSRDFRLVVERVSCVHLCIPKVVKHDRVYGKVQNNKRKALEKHSFELAVRVTWGKLYQ